MSHGWQSESTDGPKGGWSCVFWSGCNGCSGHLLDVMWFSAVVVVVVVWCSGVVVVMCNKCIVAVAIVVVAAVENRMLQNAAPLRKSAP